MEANSHLLLVNRAACKIVSKLNVHRNSMVWTSENIKTSWIIGNKSLRCLHRQQLCHFVWNDILVVYYCFQKFVMLPQSTLECSYFNTEATAVTFVCYDLWRYFLRFQQINLHVRCCPSRDNFPCKGNTVIYLVFFIVKVKNREDRHIFVSVLHPSYPF